MALIMSIRDIIVNLTSVQTFISGVFQGISPYRESHIRVSDLVILLSPKCGTPYMARYLEMPQKECTHVKFTIISRIDMIRAIWTYAGGPGLIFEA